MKLHAFLTAVNEAKFRKPQLMYHGTSTSNLRSILKNGVVPDPLKKVWDRDMEKEPSTFSLSSLEGSYWSSSLNAGRGSAGKAVRTFGGNVLLVVAQIQEASAFADEDDVRGPMQRAVGKMLSAMGSSISIEAANKIAAHYYYNGADHIKTNLIHDYGKQLHLILIEQDVTRRSKQPINFEMMKKALEAMMAIGIAEEFVTYQGSFSNSPVLTDYETLVDRGLAPPIVSRNEALSQQLDSLEELSRAYRDKAHRDKGPGYGSTLRINEPVGFRGASRIIALVTPGKYSHGGTTTPETFWHGEPPDQYFDEYRHAVGEYPGAVNPQGDVVYPSDKEILGEAVELPSPVDMWAYAIVVAEAYQKAPTSDPRASEAYKAMVVSTQRLFQQVNKMVNVQFTKDDPYKGPEDAAQDVIQNKNLSVFSGGSPHPVMSDEQNTMFRTIHDYYTHIGKNIGPSKRGEKFKTHSFKFRGELNSYLTHTKLAPQQAIPALFTEVVGQLSYYVATGKFAPQKAAILDGFDYTNLGRMSPERKQRYDQIVAQLQDKSQSHVDTEFGKISKDKIKWGLLSPGAGANREKILATVGGNEGEEHEDADPGMTANPEMLTPLKPGIVDSGTASGWDWDDPQHGFGKEKSMNMLQDK